MKENIVKHRKELEFLFREKLSPILIESIIDHNAFIQEIFGLQKDIITKLSSLDNKTDVLSSFLEYKKKLSNLIKQFFDRNAAKERNIVFQEYEANLDQFILTLDAVIVATQEKDRFYPIASDNWKIKIQKSLKRGFFKTSKLPVRFFNLFRKNKKPILFWKHRIPYQNITDHYFKSVLFNSLIPVMDLINREISEITNDYWKIDIYIDHRINEYLLDSTSDSLDKKDLILKEIPSFELRLETLKKHLNKVFEKVLASYEKALLKSDTIELSAADFDKDKVGLKKEKIVRKIFKNEKLWENTYEVLKDDWDLDVEIYQLMLINQLNYNTLIEKTTNRSLLIKDQLDTAVNYFNDASRIITETKNTDSLKKIISEEAKRVSKTFSKQIVDVTVTLISSQDIPSIIYEFETQTLQYLQQISEKRAISDDKDYLTPTESSRVNYTSPNELINYESWPIFSKKINAAKVGVTSKLEEIIETLNELAQIIEFHLQSALSLFDQTINTNDPKSIALEGYQKNLEKIKHIKNTLESFDQIVSDLLQPGLRDFNKNIIALTESENIYQIKLTIAKAKSLEKGKRLKSKILNKIKNFIPLVIFKTKITWQKGTEGIRKIWKRTGLYDGEGEVTKDVFDFLKEADQALDQLPFVYQRLFRSETLDNEDLFVGRNEALHTLEIAYQTWKKSNFSTVIINGERGAGKTSLIHYFLKSFEHTSEIFIMSPVHTVQNKNQFYTYLNQYFSKNLITLEDWIDFLNTGSKKVIVLENIQYLYHRKINGLEAMDLFLELMYATQKSVFWIFTCAKFTFQYLDKSIQISEQFSFQITMDDIDKTTMTSALIKRHKMSGYTLFFEEPPKEYLNKKFFKLKTEEKQHVLREEFYKDLNKIANSNFRIAFMYWLRSTVEINGNVIHMRSLKNVDLSFLEKLSPNKLFVLNMILLHEKLKLSDVVVLMGTEKKQVERMMSSLYENGLLTIDDNDYYNINILLYRQITSLLKSKNFLY